MLVQSLPDALGGEIDLHVTWTVKLNPETNQKKMDWKLTH